MKDTITDDSNLRDEFTKWVHSYSDAMYSWALHKTSDEMVAQDIVQETFLSAYKSLDKFREDSKPKTWLFSILNNKIIDHYRRKIKYISTDNNKQSEKKAFDLTEKLFDENGKWKAPESQAFIDDDIHLLDDDEFRKVMELCLDDLPENWRFAVNSKYLLEKDGKDICQELEITPSNYWQIIHRAKLMLKKCIDLNWFNK
ncbi:MAG: sigma-70 family RNA polymerase sigma factor [Chitinophagales bacterium]